MNTRSNLRKARRWAWLPLLVASVSTVAACGPSVSDDTTSKGDKQNGDDGQFGGGDDTDGGTGTKTCTSDPSFFDIPGDNCDNDGDGQTDHVSSCDTNASDGSAAAFARALGICDDANEKGYGLVSATFTQGYSQTEEPRDEQHGVLSKFGNVLKPREGSMLGVLSTGYAQEFNGHGQTPFVEGTVWWESQHGSAPPGFPKAAGGCSQSKLVTDVAGVKLTLKAPKNATGLKFDFNFHSSEWPAYICTDFNDGFVAWLTAKGFNGGKADNISFDAKGNPVSVNNGFFDRCTAGAQVGCAGQHPGTAACPGGPSELAGTGFGVEGEGCDFGRQVTMGGATGWLSSQAAIQPGETFTLEFMIWDAGDGDLDSSVLLDHFQWLGDEDIKTSTDRPVN